MVVFINTEGTWHLYSFVSDEVEKSTIFINDVDPVVFHVCDDYVAVRIATQTVRLKVAIS